MRRHGKTAVLVTCFAVVSLLFGVCGHAAAEDFPVNNPPVGMVGAPVLGVRITAFSFADTSSNDLIVGVPPLADGKDDLTDLSIDDWRLLGEGCNRLSVTFLSLPGTLALKIGHGSTCDTIENEHVLEFPNIYSSLSVAGQSAFDGGLNILQLNIASLESGTNIKLSGLEWAGVHTYEGDFDSLGSNQQFSLTGYDGGAIFMGPNSPMTLTADLVLEGNFGISSYVELLFGKFTPPNMPPDCVHNILPHPTTLWPPTGEFWEVGVSVTDPDGDPTVVTVNSINQDEPVCDSAGPGPCQPDATIVNGLARLRAERNPTGNGRVYAVDFTADDGKGGTCTGQVLVGVPKNRAKHGVPVDDGPLYSSTSP